MIHRDFTAAGFQRVFLNGLAQKVVPGIGELHVDNLAGSLGGGQFSDLVGVGLHLVLEVAGLGGVVVNRLDDAGHDVLSLPRIGFVFGGDDVDEGEEAFAQQL